MIWGGFLSSLLPRLNQEFRSPVVWCELWALREEEMAQGARLHLRMQRELKLLLTDPPHGASFPSLASSSSLSSIHARKFFSYLFYYFWFIENHLQFFLLPFPVIEGPEGTVYAKGLFKLKVQIPERFSSLFSFFFLF